MNKSDIVKQQSDFILYTSKDGDVNVEVFLKDETVWLTQKAMAGLFGVKVPAISKHLANIYETRELSEEPTISILETVQKEGDREVLRKMDLYYLHAIIAVGFQVNSVSSILETTAPDGKTYKTHILLSGMISGEVRVKLEEEEAVYE